MAQDPSELVIAGSGDIAFAPFGTTLPETDPTESLASGFVNAGYATEEGLTLGVEPTVEKHMAWQSKNAVRIELVAQEITVGFELEQWNGENVVFAFGGGEVVAVGGGVYRYNFPTADEALDDRTLVCDWQDGPTKNYRLVIPKGNVTEGTETNLTRGSLAVLPVTIEATATSDGIAYILTDDPAWSLVT